MNIAQVTRNLHPRRLFDSFMVKAIGSFGTENDPIHNIDTRFKNTLRTRRHIKPRHYGQAYRAVQVVCRHLEEKKDESMYLVASTTDLIDKVLETDPKAFKALIESMKKCARIGDPGLWKEYEKEIKFVILSKTDLVNRIRSTTERIIDSYTTLGRYLPGKEIPPAMIGIGAVIFQYAKDPKNDITVVGEINAKWGVRVTKDDVRAMYVAGRRFLYPASDYGGGQLIDPHNNNKQVYQLHNNAIGRYLQEMQYASHHGRVDAIIGLFSFSPLHPPVHRLDGLARKMATLPAYYDPQLVKLRERLGDSAAADLLFSQLVDSVADPNLPEPHRISITKLALLVEPTDLSTAISLISEVLELEDEETQTELFRKIESHVLTRDRNIKELFREVFRASLSEYARKYPEKPLEDVVNQFLTHPRLSERVTTQQMDSALAQFEQYEVIRSELAYDSIAQLAERLSFAKRNPDTPPAEYLAMFAEMFRKAYGLYPFNTQVITCLIQLELAKDTGSHGVYSQVETGEGKSINFALLSAYYGVKGRKVDVVSFNEYLSMRDSERFGEFYSALGLKSRSFSHNDIGSPDFNDVNIIYSTHVALVLHYLNQGLQGRYFLSNEPRIGLVDEADSLLLDNFESKARIASAPDGTRRNDFPVAVYQDALTFAKRHTTTILEDGVDAVPLEDFKKSIMPYARGKGADWSDTDLLVLIHFANEALHLEKGHDYIIRTIEDKEQIEIIDSDHTGRRLEGSQWSYGLHECVAVKEEVFCPPSQDTLVEHSHHTFFNRYEKIHCLSGTLGDTVDRAELRTLYGLKGFDVPPHRTSLRVDDGLRLYATREAHHARILEVVSEKASSGQPTLIVASDVNQAREFRTLLERNGFPSNLLDDVDNQLDNGNSATETEIIHHAGQLGQITIATNTSGRGTDIVIAPDTKELGGLHVVIGFLPVNTRVERQMRGRAGRQGNPGSCEVAAFVEDGGFVNRLSARERELLRSIVSTFGEVSDINFDTIQFLRELHGVCHSAIELYKTPFETKHDEVVEKFFTRMRETVDTVKVKEDLPEDDARALLHEILASWATVYRAYDRERALAEIRLSNYVKSAMKSDFSAVDISEIPTYRSQVKALSNSYEGVFVSITGEQRALLDQILEERALMMTIGRLPELYQGCIEFIDKLDEVIETACKDCFLHWKEIVNQHHLDLRELARLAKEQAAQTHDLGDFAGMTFSAGYPS